MLESSHLSRQYAQTRGTVAEFEIARTRPLAAPDYLSEGQEYYGEK